jgi:hypothetical protein
LNAIFVFLGVATKSFYVLKSIGTMQAIVALCALSTAAALVGGPSAKAGTALNARSKSVPFLDAPANLDSSMPGYAGFDPIGLASLFPAVSNTNYSSSSFYYRAYCTCIVERLE